MKNSIKSCFGVICIVHFITFAQAQPQSKLSISARVDFYSIPLNDPGTDILDPKYDVTGKLGLNQAIYADLNWWFAKNIGASFGLGMHNFNYSVDIFVPREAEGFQPLIDDHRSWRVVGVSPTIGIIWRLNKFQTQFCVSNFEPISIKQSQYTQNYAIHSFDPEAESWHSTEITEDLTPFNSFSSYNLWLLYFQYQLTDNVRMLLGFETTIRKTEASPYRIKIEEYDDLQVENKTTANDFAFTPYYRALTFGMSYTFNLKKGDKVKDGNSNPQ